VLQVLLIDEYEYRNNQQCRKIAASRRTDHLISYFLILHHPVSYYVISISSNTMSHTDVYNQIRCNNDVPADMTVGLAVMTPERVGAASGAAGSTKSQILLL
jgi:hypothetical protein